MVWAETGPLQNRIQMCRPKRRASSAAACTAVLFRQEAV